MGRKIVLMQRVAISLIIIWCSWCSPALSLDNYECFFCHGQQHPGATAANTDDSRRRFFIDPQNFNRSVHNLNGVGCTECHADINSLKHGKAVPHVTPAASPTCTDCHSATGAAFASSVHAEASNKGIIMRCYACHDPHYVIHQEAASVSERQNRMCLRCHNPYIFHDWLPQKEAHFSFVECTACHAPKVAHHVHLTFYDLVSNQFLSGDTVLNLLRIDAAGFLPLIDKNQDRIIDVNEFETLGLMLRQRDTRIIFHAELVADLAPAVHSLTKKNAEKNCGNCHTANSPFFNNVTIVLSKADGTVDHHEVERAVLEGYHLSHFYALASTRFRFLDKVGIAMLACGFCLVMGHLSVRIITVRQRRPRRQTQSPLEHKGGSA